MAQRTSIANQSGNTASMLGSLFFGLPKHIKYLQTHYNSWQIQTLFNYVVGITDKKLHYNYLY